MTRKPSDPTLIARRVDLEAFAEDDREDAWRAIAAANFELSDLPTRFTGTGRLHQLGPLSLTRSSHPQQTFTRTAARARRDGVYFILCSVELSSGFRALTNDRAKEVGVKQVTLWDLSKPSVKVAQAGDTLCAVIDRDALRAVLPSTNGLNGLTLNGLGDLFVDHLLSLEQRLGSIPECAAGDLGRATVQLLAACVRGELGAEEVRLTVTELLLHRAERYIASRMQDPDLSPEQVASALGVSRTSLYSMFKDLGGVSSRIRDLRLEAARDRLASGRDVRVGEVAYAVGFKSEAQFSRAFRAQFGTSPGQSRRTA